MKSKLFECSLWKKKNFGYASILVAFFLERVTSLSPDVTLLPSPPCEPKIMRWGDLFLRKVGGEVQGDYHDVFYSWWSSYVPDME